MAQTARRSSQYVEVQLEIGHRATPRTQTNTEGHTHDWTVFVRGPENSNIQHFVEKVVFHLHESFPKPKRVMKEPPYAVSESGYAGFELPVEVYFKNKEEPKKINFDYDLYLRLDDVVSNTRREKLTFQNPSNEFKKKLLKAGGVTNDSSCKTSTKPIATIEEKPVSTGNCVKPSKYNSPVSSNESKRAKTSALIPSKDKSLNSAQYSSATSSSNSSANQEKHPILSSNNKQFTDLFGPPIQARPSSEAKNKESSKNKSQNIASKGLKNDGKPGVKSSKNSLSPAHSVDSKSDKELKVSNKSKDIWKKRNFDEKCGKQKKKSLSPICSENIDKKSSDSKESKKRRISTSSNSSSVTYSSHGGSAEPKTHKYSPKSSSNKDHESKKESKKQKVSSKDINSASGVKKESSTSTKISFSNNNSSTTIEIKSVKKEKTWDNEVKKSKSKEFKSSEFKSAKENLNNSNNSAQQSNPKAKIKDESNINTNTNKCGKSTSKHLKVPKQKYNSTLREVSCSPSSVMSGVALSSSSSIHGPINSIIADMDSHESMSPLLSDHSITPKLYNQTNNNRRVNNIIDSDSSDSDNTHTRNRSVKTTKSNNKIESESPKPQQNHKRKRDSSTPVNKPIEQSKKESSVAHEMCNDSVLLADLIDIQKKISESNDCDLLQKIVDIIEESGVFNMTNTTFDFDLMKLDKSTLRKLKSFFS